MPGSKDKSPVVERPALPNWVGAMLRIEESLAHGTVTLVQQFSNCRPLALAVTSPGVAYHFESCDKYPSTGAFMVLLRYAPSSRTITAQCSIEINHRTVHDADDSIRLAVEGADPSDLTAFLRGKMDLFREVFLEPRDLGPEEPPEDEGMCDAIRGRALRPAGSAKPRGARRKRKS